LAELKDEFRQSTEDGPVIFEIPLGTECFDVLVVWQKWAELHSEARTSLILEAYGDQQEKIAQASGATYEEAIQQQLLPYTIVSTFEKEPKFALLACGKDENEVKKLMARIGDAKRANGGIALPDGRVELRFPTRAMLDDVFTRLKATDTNHEFYWSVVIEAAISDRLGTVG
jgi:hypothetical protein